MKGGVMTFNHKLIFFVILGILSNLHTYSQYKNVLCYAYEWNREYYGINYRTSNCETWSCSATDMPKSVFSVNDYSSNTARAMFGYNMERTPNTVKGYCGSCDGNVEAGFGKRYKSCLSFVTHNFQCEDMIPFDCRNNGVIREPVYNYWYHAYVACKGFYYLDSAHYYKVYQFEYYAEAALNPKKKERLLDLDFCPKIGTISHKAYRSRIDKIPSFFKKVQLSFGQPRIVYDLYLSSINTIPLSQIIQKDTCLTPFCDIDKEGCD